LFSYLVFLFFDKFIWVYGFMIFDKREKLVGVNIPTSFKGLLET